MKKIIAMLLAMLMALSMFAGCVGDGGGLTEPNDATVGTLDGETETSDGSDVTENTEPVEETEATVEDETEAQTDAIEDDTKAPVETKPDESENTTEPVETEHKHNYTVKTTKPTCTSKGYKTYTCACGDSYKSDYTDKTAHNYNKSVVKPTCTAKGYTLHKCTVCGDSYKTDETKATGHKYSSKVVAPTKDSKGYTLYTCDKCGHNYKDNYTDKLPADETQPHTHNYTSKVTAPTCTSKGYTTYTCACGHSYKSNETAATGHSWGGWVETKAPTTESQGEETRTCKTCGETDTRKTDKLPAETEPDDGGIDTSGSYAVMEVFDLINAKRAEYGLAPLTYNYGAQDCANIRAAEIKTNFSHSSSYCNGDCCGTWNEIIAKGYTSATSVVEGWLNSPSHAKSIIPVNENSIANYVTNCVVARNGNYWIVMFG